MKKVSRLCLPSFFLFLVLFWTEAVQSECSNPSTRGDGGVRAFQGGGDVRVGRRSQRNVLFKTSFFFFFFSCWFSGKCNPERRVRDLQVCRSEVRERYCQARAVMSCPSIGCKSSGANRCSRCGWCCVVWAAADQINMSVD